MIFGYARVSTQDQHLDMQLDTLTKYGVERIFEEKMTGTKKDRPQLEEIINDKLVVYKLDRVSRSTKDLMELAELFEEKGVDFVSISDQIDTSTAVGKFFFRTIASIAELERDILSERTKAGLQAARARGRKGGRPAMADDKVRLALKMYDSKEYSIAEITRATGVSKTSLYRQIETRA